MNPGSNASPSDDDVLRFGPYQLEGVKRLWCNNNLVEVRPRPLTVLRYLAERQGRLVTGDELLRQLWPGIYVTKTVLRVCVRELRQALHDDPTTPQFIETIGRQGYRFIAPLITPFPVRENSFPVVSSDEGKTRHAYWNTEHRDRPPPFVGRAKELARLQEFFKRAQQGDPQILFLFGEPGIGKTTLLNHFLAQVREVRQVRIGREQCVEHYGLGEAYLPLLEAFRHLCQEPGGEQVLALLHRQAPTWLAQLPGLLKAGTPNTVERRKPNINPARMLRELVDAVESLGTDTVLVLVLEDLQWSDTATLDAVAYLAQRQQLKLFFVGTYRPTEVVVSGHPLRQVVQELYGRGQCEELALELFTEADVEEYLRQRFGRVVGITALSRMIYRRTDGNALFVVRFVDYLLQHELLIETGGQLQLTMNLVALRRLVPDSLQQTILRQIEQLTPDEQQLLGMASVGGMTFTATEIVDGTKRTLEEAEAVYDHLANRELIIAVVGMTEWPDGTTAVQYRFRHALYQEVLYEQLGQGQRMRLHRQIGQRKEAGYGELASEIAPELARHFTEGRD
jgi:predicted ATPase/DNA-binding winged helix-turn-helix (wHTH) protein